MDIGELIKAVSLRGGEAAFIFVYKFFRTEDRLTSRIPRNPGSGRGQVPQPAVGRLAPAVRVAALSGLLLARLSIRVCLCTNVRCILGFRCRS